MKILLISILLSISTALNINNGFKSVNVSEFQQTITSNNVVILDVRTSSEYHEGHIRGAINIDVQSSNFENSIARLNKSSKIAVYCRSGRRSKKAAAILSNKGYNVVELDCGVICWVSAGNQLVK